MKTLFFLASLFVSSNVIGQQYEYVNFKQVKAGVNDASKIDFKWPDNVDSAKVLTNLNLRDPLAAIEMMEKRGFELQSIHEYGPGNLLIIVSGYLRRKK